jgi:branched-chain amino acid transport system substrate-binding protein
MDAFRKALKAAQFNSVRGNFKFGNNHFPIQNFSVRKVVSDENGKYNITLKKVFTDHQDAYANNCKL